MPSVRDNSTPPRHSLEGRTWARYVGAWQLQKVAEMAGDDPEAIRQRRRRAAAFRRLLAMAGDR